MTHDCRLIGTSSGAVSGLHQPIDARCKSRPSFECLTLCASPAQHEVGLLGRDCRTTKMRKRDARAAIVANAARIRLCVKTVVARLAQRPGSSGRICKAKKVKNTRRVSCLVRGGASGIRSQGTSKPGKRACASIRAENALPESRLSRRHSFGPSSKVCPSG